MVNEQAHARIIEGFSHVFELAGQLRAVIATMRGRMEQQGFDTGTSFEPYRKVTELESAATVLMRDYVNWASPLDLSDEGD